MGITYLDAGVDQKGKDAAVDDILSMMRRTHGPAVIDLPWGFAGLYSLAGTSLFSKRLKHPVLVSCTDSVGTKVKLAQALRKHDTVGIDCVAMSINDLLCVGAQPLFFLDYIGCGKSDRGLITSLARGVIEGCLQAECALLGGETAEMPGVYPEGEYDIVGFAVGLVEKSKILDGSAVRRGDDVIGLASSGLHSNGFSLVRKILEKTGTGLEGKPGEMLLTPTRIYARAIKAVLRRYTVKKAVRAVANITGGGMIENLPRVIPPKCAVEIREGTWTPPPVFSWLQSLGGVDRKEMYRVFNMGVGMVLITAPKHTGAILRTLRRAGETASVIGRVADGVQEVHILPAS